MILIIAEKKELAQAIADALPAAQTKAGLFIKKGNYVIAHLGGHALTFAVPEQIDKKYAVWREEDLPVYFYPWPKVVMEGKKTIVDEIGKLLKECEYVIHAGDTDDEGQLLVDEVLEHFGYTGKVLRLDTSNTTKSGLEKALKKMTDNKEHLYAGYAANARSISDKIFGFSLSRHFSILNKKKLNVGRVQTPTLGLVVARDEAIEGHQKAFYYNLICKASGGGIDAAVKFNPPKDAAYLEDGKCLDKGKLEAICEKLSSEKEAFPGAVREEAKKEQPPLPFNLVKLQSFCDRAFGYSPDDVMRITQSLRDNHKAITYNRSDCQYLTEEHFKEAPEVIKTTISNLTGTGGDPNTAYEKIDSSIKSKCFNDKYVNLHFAIIPSGQKVNMSEFSTEEKNVYKVICRRYLIQFMPPCEKLIKTLEIPAADGAFKASASYITTPGFKELDAGDFSDNAEEDDEKGAADALAQIDPGEYAFSLSGFEIKELETKPPKRYTQASLNEDLTRIVKYVENPKIKELLLKKDDGKKGENGSIGTTATRSKIISSLIENGYIRQEKKNIVSTPLGRQFYNALPDIIKKADTTALWYVHQEAIIEGKEEPTALTDSVLKTVQYVIDNFKEPTITESRSAIIGVCPLCGGKVADVEKKSLSAYACQNRDCDFIIFKNAYNGKINASNAKLLLAGKETGIMQFKAKSGTKYKARLKLKDDKKSFELLFAAAPAKKKGKSNR